MLATEVANIHTRVWEHRDGRWCGLRVWRFVDVNDLISCDIYTQPLKSLIALETNRLVTIPTARDQTWQGRASCSGLTQLVTSWESLACLQLRIGSLVG